MAQLLEEAIMDLARRQHGLVTRAQLLGAGLGRDAVTYRVRTKRLRPVQHGVYRVGPLVAPHEREMAAALACGPHAVVSHMSAAALWRLVPPQDRSDPVDVTVPHRIRRERPRIRVHRGPALTPEEATVVDAVPATTPGRTLLDLARALGPRDIERAVALAERHGLVSPSDLRAAVADGPRHRGARHVAAVLRNAEGPALTRSEAEDRFLTLIRKARLPTPEANVKIAGHEVDFFWRAERLVVEVDGFAFHASRSRFEGDRLRDGELAARGLRVLRVTWRQIAREPEATLARLAQTLVAGKSR